METQTLTNLKVNTLKSTLNWTGNKVIGKHFGNIALKSAILTLEGNAIKSGAFEIDMNSLTSADLEDKTYNEMLVGHLKSADFFNTVEFPTASFNIGSVVTKTDTKVNIKGILIIKGISNEIEFSALIENNEETFVASAKIIVDRTKFDIKYGSGNFFSNLGDKMIKDEFEIDLVLIANK